MSQAEIGRFADRLLRWGSRRADAPPEGVLAGADRLDNVQPTKALGKFLTHLSATEGPVLLDLGPVVGANVAFFGEQLGCKIYVLDLYAEIERAVGDEQTDGLAELITGRVNQGSASVDGVLCWDVLDYLDKATAVAVARQLTRVLKPGGVLLGFFATLESPSPSYARYAIVDEATLRQRPQPSSRGRVHVFANRDITRMFEGLTVVESFLLLTKTREMLFRKPPAAGVLGPRDASRPA